MLAVFLLDLSLLHMPLFARGFIRFVEAGRDTGRRHRGILRRSVGVVAARRYVGGLEVAGGASRPLRRQYRRAGGGARIGPRPIARDLEAGSRGGGRMSKGRRGRGIKNLHDTGQAHVVGKLG